MGGSPTVDACRAILLLLLLAAASLAAVGCSEKHRERVVVTEAREDPVFVPACDSLTPTWWWSIGVGDALVTPVGGGLSVRHLDGERTVHIALDGSPDRRVPYAIDGLPETKIVVHERRDSGDIGGRVLLVDIDTSEVEVIHEWEAPEGWLPSLDFLHPSPPPASPPKILSLRGMADDLVATLLVASKDTFDRVGFSCDAPVCVRKLPDKVLWEGFERSLNAGVAQSDYDSGGHFRACWAMPVHHGPNTVACGLCSNDECGNLRVAPSPAGPSIIGEVRGGLALVRSPTETKLVRFDDVSTVRAVDFMSIAGYREQYLLDRISSTARSVESLWLSSDNDRFFIGRVFVDAEELPRLTTSRSDGSNEGSLTVYRDGSFGLLARRDADGCNFDWVSVPPE